MGITPVFMGVMVLIFYKKNYTMCRNSIYNSKYTLHGKQKQVLYSYDKNPGKLHNDVYTVSNFRISTNNHNIIIVKHCMMKNAENRILTHKRRRFSA